MELGKPVCALSSLQTTLRGIQDGSVLQVRANKAHPPTWGSQIVVTLDMLNLLATGICGSNFKSVIFKLIAIIPGTEVNIGSGNGLVL